MFSWSLIVLHELFFTLFISELVKMQGGKGGAAPSKLM